MSIPSAPTLRQLVIEGLNKGGEGDPSSSLISRAETYWVEEIKNDIWTLCKKLKLLHITAYGIFNQGQSKYSNPTDFSSDLSLTILDGSVRGTAQGGTVSTITLASDDVSTQDSIIGKEIIILSGTGTASWSQVISYDSSTKVATVSPNFTTAPASGSGYMVIDREYPVSPRPVFQKDELYQSPQKGIAAEFYPIGDEDYGEFILNKAPDKVYGARLRYYANIMRLDNSSTHMSTIYQRGRAIFVEGIAFKQLDDNDDDDAETAERRYKEKLFNLVARETYGMDISNLRDRVMDYM